VAEERDIKQEVKRKRWQRGDNKRDVKREVKGRGGRGEVTREMLNRGDFKQELKCKMWQINIVIKEIINIR
jgi:hypothetical protein